MNYQRRDIDRNILPVKRQPTLKAILQFLFIYPGLLLTHIVFAVEYKVAVTAYNGTAAAYKKWNATVEYLTQKIPEHTFKLVPVVSLNELTASTGKNMFDFVLTNPSTYIEQTTYYGTKAIATLNNKRANTAQDRFGSVIFVHASNDEITDLKSLRNRTIMVVSKSAFGGWRIAWQELLKQGINPYKDLKDLLYTKNTVQTEVVHAVLSGKVDAGVVRTDLLERMESDGKLDMRYLRVVNNKDIKGFPFFLSTDLYPEWAFTTVKNTPNNVVQQVQNVLFSMPGNSQAAITGKYVGWLPAKDYNSVKQLMKQLEVGPYAAKK